MLLLFRVFDIMLLIFGAAVWCTDRGYTKRFGSESAYLAKILQKDGSGLKKALSPDLSITEETRQMVLKRLKAIQRWYWLSQKKATLVWMLLLQECLVVFAKQNAGLIIVEAALLVVVTLIMIASWRTDKARVEIEVELKKYEDRLWFEYTKA